MGDSAEDRQAAAALPEGDVVGVLLEQHARIRDLFAATASADAGSKQQRFDELRTLLAVHESAEEMIVRPITADLAGQDIVDARNHEEKEAAAVLKELEGMEVNSGEFDAKLAGLKQSVAEHAEKEESEEFPHLVRSCGEEERLRMGHRLQIAEAGAPTHPHPSAAGSTAAQWALGPFAAMMDRARDTLQRTS